MMMMNGLILLQALSILTIAVDINIMAWSYLIPVWILGNIIFFDLIIQDMVERHAWYLRYLTSTQGTKPYGMAYDQFRWNLEQEIIHFAAICLALSVF